MSENPGECAYQYCTKPQSEHIYYLCETHYQQAWDNVLSKSPEWNRKRAPENKRALSTKRESRSKSELKPYMCSRGHHVDPTNHTAQIQSKGKTAWMECRACRNARIRMYQLNIKDPEILQKRADENYQKILTQIGKEGK